MTPCDTLRISLELDPRSEPIAGRIGEEDGDSRAFHGWLGLIAALRAIQKGWGAVPAPERVHTRKDSR